MIDVLGNTYYRIARVLKGLKPWANKLYDVYAPAYIAACILSNLTVLCVLFLRIKYHLSDIKSSQVFQYLSVFVGFPIWTIYCFWGPDTNGELYDKLEIRYKNDKNPVLKGWIIAVYCIISFFAVLIV